jgi:hypothetical protein
MMGVYPYENGESGTGHIAAFETMLGAPADRWISFLSYGSWADLRSSADSQVTAFGVRAMYALPLTVGPGGNPTTPLADVAGGSNDADFTYVANRLMTLQPSGIIHIRLGWEFNGAGGANFFPWGAVGNAASYIAAFQRVVTLMRGISSRFKFEWCINNSGAEFDPATAYPGDTYVDVVGMDVYFNNTYDSADPTIAWGYRYNGFAYGMQYAANFATTHSKPFAISEWGITSDAYAPIITLMRDFLISSGAVYHGYWDSTAGISCRLSDGSKPTAAAAFTAAFGLPTITTTAAQTVEVGTALTLVMKTAHPATLALGTASAGIALVGSNLSIPAQGSPSTLSAVVNSVDARGLTASKTFTITVVAAYAFTNSEAATYVARRSSTPYAYKQAFDTYVGSLKSSGVYALADVIIPMYRETNRADAKLNILGAYGDLVEQGAPDFTSAGFRYAAPGGTPGYLTGMAGSRTGNKFVRNSASIGVWNFAETQQGPAAISIGGNAGVNPRNGGLVNAGLNDYANATATVASAVGFLLAIRTSSATGVQIDRNGVQVATNTQSSGVAPGTTPLTLFGYGNGFYGAWEVGFVFIGAGLSAAQRTALYNANVALKQALEAA